MTRHAVFTSLALFLATLAPAQAIVGPSSEAGGLEGQVVMLLALKGRATAVCTAVLVRDDVALTASHCIDGAEQLLVRARGQSIAVTARTLHPDFVRDAIRKRVRSIDLAMIKLAKPLPGADVARISGESLVRTGDAFRVAGYGVTQEGTSKGLGALRMTTLIARAPLSSVLLWARDPDNKGAGACTGDSGGPVYSGSNVVAISTWASGDGRKGCGALTQAVYVAPHRGWIDKVLSGW